MSDKGSKYERKLVNEMESEGIPAFRFLASGAGHNRESPDTWIKTKTSHIVAELKYSSDGYCYITEEEWEGLKKFADKWEAIPLAIARFKGDTSWYCINLRSSQVEENLTDSNTLSMKENHKEEYWKLRDLMEKIDAHN